jgi:PEP-CTERM motif
VHPAVCTYNDLVEGNGAITLDSTIGWEAIDTVAGTEMHAIADGIRSWAVPGNFEDLTPRQGTYCVVGFDAGCSIRAVPEPSSLWLLLAGALAGLWLKLANQ